MEIGWDIIAILSLVGLCAGFIDSIAGGGGLIALPAILATGMSPLAALGTNKAQCIFGTITATYRFAKAGLVEWRYITPAIIGAAVGACIGVWAVQSVSPGGLKFVIPLLLLLAAGYFLFSPRMHDEDAHRRLSTRGFTVAAAGLGFYDGFFGPGAGSFYTAGLVALYGMGLTRATAHTKVLNMTSNVIATVAFSIAGYPVWKVGIAMGLGQIAGAWIGTHYAVRHGAKVIRPLIIIVSLGLTLRLLLDPENPLRQFVVERFL